MSNPTPPPPSPSNYPRPSGIGVPPVQAGKPNQEDCLHATLVWALSFLASFVPALIFLIIAKDRPYVYRHAALCLTMHIATVVIGMIVGIISFVTCGAGLLLYAVVAVLPVIVCVLGIIAANKGEEFNPPYLSDWTRKIFSV